MKVVAVCVAAAVVCCVNALLPPLERSYKILMVVPFWARSHKNVFMPLAEALADRGHNVVMLTMLRDSPKHPNITEIVYDLPNLKFGSVNVFDSRANGITSLQVMEVIFPAMTKELYKVPQVKQLYESRKQFDLVVLDYLFSPIVYPFAYEMPFIIVSTPGLDPRHSAVLGNVINPSYMPHMWTWSSVPFPMSLWHRLKNTYTHVWAPAYFNHHVMPAVQTQIRAHFPDFPPLLEMERNQSLTLLNSHFSFTRPVPLMPSQVEVGAMHCRPAKPLPPELESWITEAGSAGVVYFSLGSTARGETMPPQYLQIILETFRRLPQRVLWKYEGELDGVPDNVRISSWLPQQDVLAHDNVKMFVTQGGLLSLQESIFHATPLLVLPICCDQPRNGMFVESSGLGRVLKWEELTADNLVDALTDIITNTKYKENVARTSEALKDQVTQPQELAVFWIEYVIRHRGAPQLKSPAVQLSWVEFLLLDVVGFLLVALLLLLLLLYRLIRAISTAIFGDRAKKQKTN